MNFCNKRIQKRIFFSLHGMSSFKQKFKFSVVLSQNFFSWKKTEAHGWTLSHKTFPNSSPQARLSISDGCLGSKTIGCQDARPVPIHHRMDHRGIDFLTDDSNHDGRRERDKRHRLLHHRHHHGTFTTPKFGKARKLVFVATLSSSRLQGQPLCNSKNKLRSTKLLPG